MAASRKSMARLDTAKVETLDTAAGDALLADVKPMTAEEAAAVTRDSKTLDALVTGIKEAKASPESVAAAMAVMVDAHAAQALAKEAAQTALDAKRAAAAHTVFRHRVVAAVFEARPGISNVDTAKLLWPSDWTPVEGETAAQRKARERNAGRHRLQIMRDRGRIEWKAAIERFNVAAGPNNGGLIVGWEDALAAVPDSLTAPERTERIEQAAEGILPESDVSDERPPLTIKQATRRIATLSDALSRVTTVESDDETVRKAYTDAVATLTGHLARITVTVPAAAASKATA